MVMMPEDLTLAMVSLDWANAPLVRVVAMANASNCFFIKGSCWFMKLVEICILNYYWGDSYTEWFYSF